MNLASYLSGYLTYYTLTRPPAAQVVHLLISPISADMHLNHMINDDLSFLIIRIYLFPAKLNKAKLLTTNVRKQMCRWHLRIVLCKYCPG